VGINRWIREQIRAELVARNITQAQLGEMLGVTQQRVGRLLSQPSAVQLDKNLDEQLNILGLTFELRPKGSGLPKLIILPVIWGRILDVLELEVVLIKG
jgi:transcriptional regulator with XRE-family HTH domain